MSFTYITEVFGGFDRGEERAEGGGGEVEEKEEEERRGGPGPECEEEAGRQLWQYNPTSHPSFRC